MLATHSSTRSIHLPLLHSKKAAWPPSLPPHALLHFPHRKQFLISKTSDAHSKNEECDLLNQSWGRARRASAGSTTQPDPPEIEELFCFGKQHIPKQFRQSDEHSSQDFCCGALFLPPGLLFPLRSSPREAHESPATAPHSLKGHITAASP